MLLDNISLGIAESKVDGTYLRMCQALNDQNKEKAYQFYCEVSAIIELLGDMGIIKKSYKILNVVNEVYEGR